MKLIYRNQNGEEIKIGEIITNHSMTLEEALEIASLSTQNELEIAYNNNNPAVYIDDENQYAIDFEKIEMHY